jgi:hypothetical protein
MYCTIPFGVVSSCASVDRLNFQLVDLVKSSRFYHTNLIRRRVAPMGYIKKRTTMGITIEKKLYNRCFSLTAVCSLGRVHFSGALLSFSQCLSLHLRREQLRLHTGEISVKFCNGFTGACRQIQFWLSTD